MLLNFRVANYRSFRDEVSISMLATRLDAGYGRAVQVAADASTVDVLPVIAVLGANASGKSNLLRAMAAMRDYVLTSASRPRYDRIRSEPFALDPKCAEAPTVMELDFVLDGSRYLYGFEVRKGTVVEEWLHTFPHKRTQVLFDRERTSEFTFGKNLQGQNKVITEITRPQVLFLSAAAQAGHPTLSRIYDYFLECLVLLDVPDRSQISTPTVRRLQEKRGRAIELLSRADLGIADARVSDLDVPAERREMLRETILKQMDFPRDMPDELRDAQIEQIMSEVIDPEPTVELFHRGVGGRRIPLPFEEESLGTKSWLSFVSSALDALDKGGVLLVDELDASLHPLLLAEALTLFQSKRSNPRGAQLIFTTHDVTLFSNSLDHYRLSRGQIWLVEKDDSGASLLVPLADYRPRKGEDLARGYLQGRYGGTPRILRGASGPLALTEVQRGDQ